MAFDAGSIVANLKLDDSQFQAATKKAKMSAGDLGRGLALAGGAITGALGLAVNSAVKFEDSIANIATLGVKDMESMREAVLDVSTAYGQDLNQAAEAAYQAISAGADAAQVPNMLAEAAEAAVGGMTDMVSTMDMATSIQNAYGQSLSDIGDIYNQAQVAINKGKTTFIEMKDAVGRVAPIFSAAGVSTEELFASLSSLTSGGIITTESITGLKAAMTSIISGKVAQTLGDQFNVSALRTMTFKEYLDQLKTATGGNISAMQEALGSVEAFNAVLAMTGGGAQKFSESMDMMTSGLDAMGQAAQAKMETTGFALSQMKAEMHRLWIEVGDALTPALTELAKAALPIAEWVGKMAKEHPGIIQLVGAIGLLAAATGSVMAAVGPLSVTLKAISAALTGIGPAMAGLSGMSIPAFVAAAGPWVVAIGAAAYALWKIVEAAGLASEAIDGLRQTNEQLDRVNERGRKQLEAKGIAIDNLAWKEMNAAQQTQWIVDANNKLKEREAETYRRFQAAATGALDGATRSTEQYSRAMETTGKTVEQVTGQARESLFRFDLSHRESPSVLDLAFDSFSVYLGGLEGLVARIIGLAQKAKDALMWGFGGGFANGGVVPGFASGGVVGGHRIVRVGEMGPEMVALPSGSRVMSHGDMMRSVQANSGTNISIAINGGVTDRNAAEHLAREIDRRLRDRLRNRMAVHGVSAARV
jgi:TP901 family phage tail tape measure protein